jgi:tripartite-type tricarboxylate transporter receptor subunit TctC
VNRFKSLAVRLATLTAAGALLASSHAALAAWPDDRPIEIIVGFAPGGPSDVLARTIAPYLAKQLGPKASVVILNKPGAGGALAVAQLARSKPDGYSIGIVNSPGYFFLPMYRPSGYELKDLSLVARVVRDPQIMVGRKDGKYVDLQQIVSALKAKPESISIGNNGTGTSGHLGVIRLEQLAGVKFNVVPYNGSAQQKMALAGKQLDLAMLAASEVPDPDLDAVPMRITATFAKTASANHRQAPTTFASGFPVELTSERGFAAPSGVAAETLKRLQVAIEAVMKDPNFVAAAKNDAPVLSFLGGADWTEQMQRDAKTFEDTARSLAKQQN